MKKFKACSRSRNFTLWHHIFAIWIRCADPFTDILVGYEALSFEQEAEWGQFCILKVDFLFLDEFYRSIAVSFIEVAWGKCSLYFSVQIGDYSMNIKEELVELHMCDRHLPTKVHRTEKNNVNNILPDSHQ